MNKKREVNDQLDVYMTITTENLDFLEGLLDDIKAAEKMKPMGFFCVSQVLDVIISDVKRHPEKFVEALLEQNQIELDKLKE